jgi:D-glycerate 3-kinase
MMTAIAVDKSHICIPFILSRLEVHRQRWADAENPPPFFLGLNGVQGAGKTVLVRAEAWL